MARVLRSHAKRDAAERDGKRASEQSLWLLDMPSELLYHVLGRVDEAQALLHAAASCKTFNTLEQQWRDDLWRSLTLDKYPVAGSNGLVAQMPWRGRFKYYKAKEHGSQLVYERGENLNAAQLNERFEFFVEVTTEPEEHESDDEGESPPSRSVTFPMKIDTHGLLSQPKGSNVILDTLDGVGVVVSVRRVCDCAVAVLFEGTQPDVDEDDGDTSWRFQADSRWDLLGRRLPDHAFHFYALERASMQAKLFSPFEGMDTMFCWCPLTLPENEEGEEVDLSKPVTIDGVALEISNERVGELSLDAEIMSKLLTAPHLVRWERYE